MHRSIKRNCNLPNKIAVAPASLITGKSSLKYESLGGAPFKSKWTIRWCGMYRDPSDVITGGVDSSTTEKEKKNLYLCILGNIVKSSYF